MNIKLKKLYEDAQLPTRAHPTDAGADLYAYLPNGPVTIEPGEYPVLIDVGFAMAIPEGYEAQIRPRSGMGCKKGIGVPNSPGTIDSHYRAGIKVALVNLTDYSYTVHHGDRIAQMIINQVEIPTFETVENLDETDRGISGFGDSGK